MMMKTNLRPYNPSLYTPARTLNVGDLAITLDDPRGYCVVVSEIDRTGGCFYGASFYFLDDKDKIEHKCDIKALIPTGKTPLSFLELYEPDPISFDRAIDLERKFPDFVVKSTKPKSKGGGVKRAKKELTDVQKKLITELVLRRLKGEQI